MRRLASVVFFAATVGVAAVAGLLADGSEPPRVPTRLTGVTTTTLVLVDCTPRKHWTATQRRSCR